MSNNKDNHICCHCNKSFSTKYILSNHQKTSKSCLKKQGIQIQYEHRCDHCKYETNTKQHFNNHIKVCKKRKEAEEKSFQEIEKELTRLKIEKEVTEKLTISGSENFKPDKKVQKREKTIQRRLAKELNGEMEVKTSHGNIDILTPNELIEVKYFRNWKHAEGQLRAYSEFYKDRKLRMHIFKKEDDIFHPEKLKEIETFLNKNNISLTIEKSAEQRYYEQQLKEKEFQLKEKELQLQEAYKKIQLLSKSTTTQSS